ncbi:G2/mitotic-specific cyclin-2 [Orobanche minor]
MLETTHGEASMTAIVSNFAGKNTDMLQDKALFVNEAANRLDERVEVYKQHVEAYKELSPSHSLMEPLCQSAWEPVPCAANKQTNMAAERKNCRALGNIGNLVTVYGVDGKAIPQVSRPVTRSFCAQLLANAQAEKNKNTMAANIKGPIVADGLLPEKRAAVRLTVQKKVAFKPKLEEIIEISPDFREVIGKNAVEKSAKKKAPTLTVALTARSEV